MIEQRLFTSELNTVNSGEKKLLYCDKSGNCSINPPTLDPSRPRFTSHNWRSHSEHWWLHWVSTDKEEPVTDRFIIHTSVFVLSNITDCSIYNNRQFYHSAKSPAWYIFKRIDAIMLNTLHAIPSYQVSIIPSVISCVNENNPILAEDAVR